MSDIFFHTDGSGYWSKQKKSVQITNMKIGYVSDEMDHGELRVYFNTENWNIRKDGLIYTDNLFLRNLKQFLSEYNFPVANVDYSEQGMQGDDFVSLDVEYDFLRAWKLKFGTFK